ncbi:MAG: ComEC/Rec2 family competence protein [Gilvibacter sp.]
MQWLNFPLVKATLVYVIGIALSAFISLPITRLFAITVLVLVIAFILFFVRRKQLKPQTFFGVLILSTFFMAGALNYQSRKPRNNSSHYSHYLTSSEAPLLVLKINTPIKSNDYYDKYHAAILRVNNQKVTGKLLLQIKKDSLCHSLIIGQSYAIKSPVTPIESAKNPYQFDYKNYLKTQHIYHKISTPSSSLISLRSLKKDLRYHAFAVQHTYSTVIDSNIKDPAAASVLKALLVGYKSDLDPTVKESFANAGVLHLLAVSGLHVGIVLLLVQRLFGFLKRLRNGRYLLAFICLCAIWSFAAITGFSASVVRAAFMFSFFTIGSHIGRGHNSINSMLVSMLVMLCMDPFLLWQVGFQLSYSAVFFILWLYPKLVSLWVSKHKILRSLWQLSCVSLTAQLGVLPLCLYYFNEFPTLFLLSNLVLVPMIGTLLSLGLILCSIQIIIPVPQIAFEILNLWVQTINRFALWIGKIDAAVIENIHVSQLQIGMLYMVFFASYLGLTSYRRFALRIFSSCTLIILFGIVINKYQRPQEELIVFNSFGQTIVGYKYNKKLSLYKDATTNGFYATDAYMVARAIKTFESKELPKYFTYKNNAILIVDDQTALPPTTLAVNTLLLTNNAKINLDRWITTLKPALIIADGNNYNNVVQQWQKSAKVNCTLFISTTKNGAYRFD